MANDEEEAERHRLEQLEVRRQAEQAGRNNLGNVQYVSRLEGAPKFEEVDNWQSYKRQIQGMAELEWSTKAEARYDVGCSFV